MYGHFRFRELSTDPLVQSTQKVAAPGCRFAQAYDQIAEPILLLDFEGKILDANIAAVELIGYSAEENPKGALDSIRESAAIEFDGDQVFESVQAGHVWRGRAEFEKRDGSRAVCDSTVSPFRDESGNIVALMCSNRVTPTGAAVSLQSDLILAAVQSSTFGVTIADATRPDLPLNYVNPAFEAMTGYTFAEIVGRNCRFLQGPDTDRLAVADIRRAIGREESMTTMLLNYRKDGSRFWNRLQLSPIHDAGNRLRAYMRVQIDVTRDVSELSIERERQKMEQLGKLAGGISHDLNNALQPILLMGAQLADELDESQSEKRAWANSIVEHGNYARQIVEKVLLFSRQDKLERTELKLASSLSQVIQFAREALPNSISFQVSIDPALQEQTAEFNQTELMQVVSNLLLNATQAMNDDGSIRVDANRVDLTESVAGFFELRAGSFAQIDVIDTGLGLSIAYGIARDWGGTIAASNETSGARFSVFIPICSRSSNSHSDD